MDKGVVTVDFNEWKKGLIGETGPLFKVDGKTLDINGVEVNVANPLIKEKAEGYKGSLADINYEIDKLKTNHY